jgi:hypothetical protein
MVRDPLAEKYPSWSPYHYSYDNPVRNFDPDGKQGLSFSLGIDAAVGLGRWGPTTKIGFSFSLKGTLVVDFATERVGILYSEQPEFQVGRVQADKILGIGGAAFTYQAGFFTGTIEDLVGRSVGTSFTYAVGPKGIAIDAAAPVGTDVLEILGGKIPEG